MKTIVTVKHYQYGTVGIYEVPDGVELKAGDLVVVELSGRDFPGVATQNAIEVADDIVEYFTAEPLTKIKAVMASNTAEPQEGPENEQN